MTQVKLKCRACGVMHAPDHEGPCQGCDTSDMHFTCERHHPAKRLDGPECDQCSAELRRAAEARKAKARAAPRSGVARASPPAAPRRPEPAPVVPKRPTVLPGVRSWLQGAARRYWPYAAAAIIGWAWLGERIVKLPQLGPVYDATVAVGLPREVPEDVRIARNLYRRGYASAAVSMLTDATVRYRRSNAAHVELAWVYWELGDPVAARRILELARRRDSSDDDALRTFGVLEYANGLRAAGERDSQRARRHFTDAALALRSVRQRDEVTLGWLSCSLYRLDLTELAGKTGRMAGSGPWQWCREGAVQ